MFPTTLQPLPDLPDLSRPFAQDNFVISNPPGGGGGGFPGSGGIEIGLPPSGTGSGSGSGRTTSVSVGTTAAGVLSSVLGIPAINWGRIAAFLLGLLFIAGGIYLIRPVQQIVNKSVKGAILA